MDQKRKVAPADLERNALDLTIFASIAIVILAAGLALLMYPAVFANRESPSSNLPRVAFYGFCALSCLLVTYIVERQITIYRLRRQMAAYRKRSMEMLMQASADLLSTMPNFSTFEDRLAMEFRRAVSAKLKLSVLVISIKPHPLLPEASLALFVLGDAAKAISRKLREQDSIYILRTSYFGLILPGVGPTEMQRISARLKESLSDASGADNRFSFKIDSINYPEQTSSAHDLELAILGWLPEEDSTQKVTNGVLAHP
jgi:GGDEF domain-containing protein